MDTGNQYASFIDLPYGAYSLEYDAGRYEENVKFGTAEFNKLYMRRVRLPGGKGNIIHLLSSTFDNTLMMLDNQSFIIPPGYRTIFYPKYSAGTFISKRYKFSVKALTKDRTAQIKTMTKMVPYNGMSLSPKSIENVIIPLSDLYEAVKPIMDRIPVKMLCEEFFRELVRISNKFTPARLTMNSGNKEWNNRIMIIDSHAFKFDMKAPLKENKSNPLYLIYLTFLRNKNLTSLGIDVDMMICAKNLFMKFNPAHTSVKDLMKFRTCLFRIMNANLDDYTNALHDNDKKDIDLDAKDHLISAAVADAIEPWTSDANQISPSTRAIIVQKVEDKVKQKAAETAAVNAAIKDIQQSVADQSGTDVKSQFINSMKSPSALHPNLGKGTLDPKHAALFNAIGSQYEPLGVTTGQMIDEDDFDEDELDGIKDDAVEILTTDEQIISDIIDEQQENTVPLKNLKTSPVNSGRDQKLREAQKKIVVHNSTIEEVLQRDSSNVPIETEDKSAVLHTSNPNVQSITFANFDKTYLDKLYVKDLVAAFDQLKDKEYPFYITSIDIQDTSTPIDLKETWTVTLVDEAGKKHTTKLDVPKFQNDRFMFINNKKYIILKQNFYNPIVKDTPDSVIITSNYKKITVSRVATKSLSSIERIFSLIKKTGDTKVFIAGNASKDNLKYISTLEYDELSSRLFKFSSKGCTIYFSRDYIRENMEDQIPADLKGDEFFIGFDGKTPICINEDTGLDRSGRTIVEIMEDNLSDQYRAVFNSIKGPKQAMYATAKLAGQRLPVISILCAWCGFTNALKEMGVEWTFDPNAKRAPQNTNIQKHIKFADGVLSYKSNIFVELIMNGIVAINPSKFTFEEFNSNVAYDEFFHDVWGTYRGSTDVKLFNDFLVDPITADVCKDMMLPTTAPGLLVYAVRILADNACVSKASDKSYRVRSIESVPAILYGLLSAQYAKRVRSGSSVPMTLKRRDLIDAIIKQPNVETYSTLNPVVEVGKTHHISPKGYSGSNKDTAYKDERKRSYDPSAVGKLAISTSADANVGINRALVVEPTLTNVRGYRAPVEDESSLKDINVFSPVELLTPGTIRNDDPIRSAIACKQSQHVVPVEDASPALISNGFDEAVQFHLSDDFVVNADEDGKVIEVNDELGFIMVQYKSGKTRAISTAPNIVYNSNSAFYLSNTLVPTHAKVGETFKKDEPLAYHPKYFKYSKMNGLRYAIGPITKIAFMSSYNTYEDAGICTAKLAKRMRTKLTFKVEGKFKRNNNILNMVKVGDEVRIGDSLIKFDVSVEDNELSRYLSKLSDENANLLSEETKTDVKADHAGTVIDIKVLTLLPPEELSPSLGKIVQQYFDRAKSKEVFLNKYDNSPGTIKAGYMLTDLGEPVKNRYNTINGYKGIDVLIEIYIEHDDVMGVGDKIALYSANKQIVSEVIPEGYEPYSEFRPDEEISALTSPGTIQRRMTASTLAIAAAMKCMIELKRKIKAEIRYK